MRVGLQLVLQNYLETTTDEHALELDMRLAELAEPLGFDSVWCVEHHFDWYSMGPDTPQILAYLAGRTRRIGLATGAVILPWNSPLRVVEKMILLDYQSQGRAIFGMGHGLARMEYDGFSREEAIQELKANGFGEWPCTSANDYIKQYILTYKRGLRNPVAAKAP